MHATRRDALALLATALLAPAPGSSALAQAAGSASPGPTSGSPGPAMSRLTAYAFAFPALAGADIRLADHAGKPILVVNTASLCGYTPQYAGLQELWQRYHDRGLLIVGVPSNDFGGQEPGDGAEIEHTTRQYGVGFPLAAKAAVKGAGAHPFYKWAMSERPLEAPRWNFHKYLVGGDGHLAAAFSSAVEPTDPRVIAAIEAQLSGRAHVAGASD